jgi:hypothetical protein
MKPLNRMLVPIVCVVGLATILGIKECGKSLSSIPKTTMEGYTLRAKTGQIPLKYNGFTLSVRYNEGGTSLTTKLFGDSSEFIFTEQQKLDGIPEMVHYFENNRVMEMDNNDSNNFFGLFHQLTPEQQRKSTQKYQEVIQYVVNSSVWN